MSNIKTIQISVIGGVGTGKSHVLATIQKALQSEYGHDLMVVSRDLYLERNLNVSDDKMEKPNKATTVMVLTELGDADYEHELKQIISSKVGDAVDYNHYGFVRHVKCNGNTDQLPTHELPELNLCGYQTNGEPLIGESKVCGGVGCNEPPLNIERENARQNAWIILDILRLDKLDLSIRKKAESKLSGLLDDLIPNKPIQNYSV